MMGIMITITPAEFFVRTVGDGGGDALDTDGFWGRT
jgi:hypothetical protein